MFRWFIILACCWYTSYGIIYKLGCPVLLHWSFTWKWIWGKAILHEHYTISMKIWLKYVSCSYIYSAVQFEFLGFNIFCHPSPNLFNNWLLWLILLSLFMIKCWNNMKWQPFITAWVYSNNMMTSLQNFELFWNHPKNRRWRRCCTTGTCCMRQSHSTHCNSCGYDFI